MFVTSQGSALARVRRAVASGNATSPSPRPLSFPASGRPRAEALAEGAPDRQGEGGRRRAWRAPDEPQAPKPTAQKPAFVWPTKPEKLLVEFLKAKAADAADAPNRELPFITRGGRRALHGHRLARVACCTFSKHRKHQPLGAVRGRQLGELATNLVHAVVLEPRHVAALELVAVFHVKQPPRRQRGEERRVRGVLAPGDARD